MEKKLCYGIIIIVVIILLILAGILLSIDEPDVTVSNIRYKSASISQRYIEFYVDLKVDNDNILGGTLKKVEANVYIDDQHIGFSYSEEEFDIKANSVSDVTVVLRVTSVPSNILSKNEFTVRVVGAAYVKVSFYDYEMPFDESRTIRIYLT